MQPGTTITPGSSNDQPKQPEAQVAAQKPPETPAAQPQEQNKQSQPSQPESFQANDSGQDDDVLIEWTASEYIDHHKTAEWYAALIIGIFVLGGLLYLITRDVISVVVVALAAALFGVSGAKKPRTLTYRITTDGVVVENKLYPFEDIKLFSVSSEGGVRSMILLPLKRFTPTLTIYYPPDMEDKIFETLSDFLPHEENHSDPVDRLMKRLRF